MGYVIYAAYGSNMWSKRFMVYINGGVFRGREYYGCPDKTPPQSLGWAKVHHRLYFAKSSSLWKNGGVAFLSCEEEKDPRFHAVVRLWKITEDQFQCIQSQEGNWYRRVLTLGEQDGLKIKTFTGCWEDEKNPPSADYLDVIRQGLKETTGWDDEEIENYIKKFLP